MKIFEAENHIRQRLRSVYEESESSGISDLVMEYVTGMNKTQRISGSEKEMSESETRLLNEVEARLLNHEPVQYIMNRSWFYGMDLYVDKGVLIPRPETEELVEWIISDVKASGKKVFNKNPAQADETTELKILDVGTGSGCIALALKKEMPLAEVWGCDISDTALNVARRNGSELDIRVDFQSVDYLNTDQQKHLPTVDIVVSNPPYVPEKDKSDMLPNVLQYEPHTALFVKNDDPLLFYKAILEFGEHRLYKHGRIYMEIHENLGPQVKELFEASGYKTELKKDMQGKDRMVRAEKG